MNGKVVFTVFVVLVVVAAVAGIAGYAYNIGLAQGMATNVKLEVPATGAVPAPYFYPPYGMHRVGGFGGFGFLGCLVPLFGFFIFFGVMRMIFFRARCGGMHHHRKWEGGAPPMFEEWHRKMHEQPQQPASEK
jgi:hypothetical protein